MLIKVFGAAVQGIEACLITIEVNMSRGIKFFLVGMPDIAVRESHERIVSAFSQYGISFPTCQIIINMAPADIRKEGAAYDLPLAVGLLAGLERIDSRLLSKYLIMGELSLDGTLQPIKGALPIAICAQEQGFSGIILPAGNAKEASVVKGLEVYGANNLGQVLGFLNGNPDSIPLTEPFQSEKALEQGIMAADFADVCGQESVKRAFEVAAAGGHNIILIGPPGSGKSMLAKRLPTILPPMTLEESLETTKIHSVAGVSGNTLITTRPFRSPHHTISAVALTGGGQTAQPGEISLAHNGILFLDELPEFSHSVLEIMRQPLEDRHITISRIKYTVDYPTGFMLVAAMNPCPCGYYNHPTKPCVCLEGQVRKYLNRVSGPLLDRIDIQVEVTPVSFDDITRRQQSESSAVIRERVVRARQLQEKRFSAFLNIHCNAQMNSKMLRQYASPDAEGLRLLKNAMQRLDLSVRAYDRILRVARTIADLEGSAEIQPRHISEAISYRNLDRSSWGQTSLQR